MKKVKFMFPIALCALLLATWSCKKKKCPEGFVCVDNTCICPEDKFEGNGMCRDLKPNEYYASLSHCICKDTIFWEIVERTDDHLRVGFDLGWGYSETGCALLKLPDGDSLYTEAGVFEQRLACPINGRFTGTQVFGKFIENDSKIRIHLKYMAYPNLEEEVGHCDFILHK